MVLIGKPLNECRAAQVERRVACAAAAAAGRASSASPVPPTPMSSLPSAGLSPTPTAATSGTTRADETLLIPITDHTAEIFFNAAALSAQTDRSAERENSKRIDYDYKVGDKVLIVKDGILRKAESRYGKEPWTITAVNTNGTIRVQCGSKSERINIRRVTSFSEDII
jgi:hypothetical protein